MKPLTTIVTISVALLCLGTAATSTDAFAQEKQKIAYKIVPENAKVTQRHAMDVGDFPGHVVGVYEIHRVFPDNPPVINGLKLVEQWNRGIQDYIVTAGPNYNYTVNIMENGDKFFQRGTTLSLSNEPGKTNFTSFGIITGGTGKMSGIQGTTRSVGKSDFAAGINQQDTEIEYWFAK